MVETDVVGLEQSRRLLRLVHARLGQIDVGPPGETVLAVPDTFAVSQENKSRHLKSPLAASAPGVWV